MPEYSLHELTAAVSCIVLVTGSFVLAALHVPIPQELAAPLHTAIGWLFGSIATRTLSNSNGRNHT